MFSDKQFERYSRQIVLSEIGLEGQKKLISTKVLVLGAGGLGSSALLYLAASGVGTIGIVDYDKVELSNLHRQIIYDTSDLNKSKVLCAKEKINILNPDVTVLIFEEKLNKNNIERIFTNFEIVVDGLDSFSDKFLVNDTCIAMDKKLVHSGVIGFAGQILTVIPKQSACLRCYFPDREPTDFRQSCKEIGVLGSCVGVLSTLQATEALKLILNIGKPLTNRVLKFNALDLSFHEFKISGKNRDCKTCGVLSMSSIKSN